jgi:pyruvate/2-oxoglutarate dehydrogenase complex dihydrolipoamide acyltransferase (E2) component
MVTVRLLFDHRLFDAATGARALARLEEILTGRIQDELRQG